MFEKPAQTPDETDVEVYEPEEVTVEADGPDVEGMMALILMGMDVSELPGGDEAMAMIEAMAQQAGAQEHGANLAEYMDESDMKALATTLIEAVENDDQSREDWKSAYSDGLGLLGLKIEDSEEPFPGAAGVHHPMLAEACVTFQARAITELFPADGPVKTEIVGAVTPERQSQAERVKDYMNYLTTVEMEEYFHDHDQMLFYLPLAGSTFKKTYYDATLRRPVSMFVFPEDFIVNYGTSDLRTSTRYTHRLKMDKGEVRKRQAAGMFRDVDLGEPAETDDDSGEITGAIDDLEGREPTFTEGDERHTLYEVYADLDLPGFEDATVNEETGEQDETGIPLPYVVTIDRDSQTILSIKRNWREDDDLRRPRQWFTHYRFLPGLGFYGLGYVHLLGGMTKTATTALRQLLDAGTLSNIPAGFKAKGLRLADNEAPLKPGEWRDVDAATMDLSKSLLPLPFKGADPSLLSLFQHIVESGQRLAQMADMQIGDLPQNAPVGSVVAAIEQGGKVMSAIHKRLHVSQAQEFKLLAEIIGESLPDHYPYEVSGGDRYVLRADFDGRVDVLPVSDPSVFSKSQRVMMAQAETQLGMQAMQAGVNVDTRALFRRQFEALGTGDIDAILPPPQEAQPADPVSENTAALAGKPLKAGITQDHQSHIKAHMAFAQTMGANPSVGPMGQQAAQALAAHMAEHWAMYYTVQMAQQIAQQTGAPVEQILQALQSGQIPPQIEAQVAPLAAQATERVMQEIQAMLPKPPDPMQQMQMQAQIQQQLDAAKEQAKAQGNIAVKQAEAQIDMAEASAEHQREMDELAAKQAHERQMLADKIAGELAKERMENQHDAEQARSGYYDNKRVFT